MVIWFPHENIRESQEDFVETVEKIIEKKECAVLHAPTGIGKTAAVLAPAIPFAKSNALTIFFLTSRHTQHKIVLDTVRAISNKFSQQVKAVSFIGKRQMCCQPNVSSIGNNDFIAYCKSLRESRSCEFFENTKDKNIKAAAFQSMLEKESPLAVEEMVSRCAVPALCPYETSIQFASKADIIIADYFYVFNPRIRSHLFSKTGKELGKSIIIIDEGHNLPERIRELMTSTLSSRLLSAALKEAKKNYLSAAEENINHLESVLEQLAQMSSTERLITGKEFVAEVEKFKPIEQMQKEMEISSEAVPDTESASSIESIAQFLKFWNVDGNEFARIVQKKERNIMLTQRCLDPAPFAKEIIKEAHSVIIMSGTLTPAAMYRDILGFPKDSTCAEFSSPFSRKNRLSLIVPRTTTKFTQRSDAQYEAIGRLAAEIANNVPGCVALFFPSYDLRNRALDFFKENYSRTIFIEQPGLQKSEKQELMHRFSSYKETGAALLAVASGSFGEGIDLPGVLKAVVVIGLPLDRPDLETKELIRYYDSKFGKGWEYGYILPATTKCLQNAGRCIRTENDFGALIFVDERYAWPRYNSCFPKDWETRTTQDPVPELIAFFAEHLAKSPLQDSSSQNL